MTDSLFVRGFIVLGMVLLPTVLYLTFIGNSLDSDLFLLIMWPPVLLGLGLFYYTIMQVLEYGRPSTLDIRSEPVEVPFNSHLGRCPRCNGKVLHGDRNCRWCGWEVDSSRLRPPV